MLKLQMPYEIAVASGAGAAPTAATHEVEIAEAGVVTHLIVSANNTWSSGGVADILKTAVLDVLLEGRTKVVDSLLLSQAAMVADHETNAVGYRESATGNGYKAEFALPIGLVDLRGKLLRARLAMPAHSGTCTNYNISLGVCGSRDLPELGVAVYERTSLVFTAAGQVLDRPFRSYGYDTIWISDASAAVSAFELIPQIGQPSHGSRLSMLAMNAALTRQESFVANSTPWNTLYKVGSLTESESQGGFVTLKVTSAGSGTVDIITRRFVVNEADKAKSRVEFNARKTYERRAATQYTGQSSMRAAPPFVGANRGGAG